MSTAETFDRFLENLRIGNSETISKRYGEITAALNKAFRNTESKTENSLRVGSFGRHTGINGISDLDMLYILPSSCWDQYKDGKQRQLLEAVKSAIKTRYPTSDVHLDRLIVAVEYNDFHIEVQPVFRLADGNYRYPDTRNGGSWKVTKPRQEMKAVSDLNDSTNRNLRRLCRYLRAWENRHGAVLGGLLLDTLAFNFLSQTSEYDRAGLGDSGKMLEDFFHYLANEPNKDRYLAPGSRQHVKVRGRFRRHAQEARDLCSSANEANTQNIAINKWKQVFGRPFPSAAMATADSALQEHSIWTNTEEQIEDYYPVDVRRHLRIDCDVKQNGFRENRLAAMLRNNLPLRSNKRLRFYITEIDVPPPYTIQWKVLNCGPEAKRRDQIRGQIVSDHGNQEKTESTDFKGDHMVECYGIKSGIVVARASIRVPITTNKNNE